MTAVPYDIEIEQGATYDVAFEWRTDNGSMPPTGPLIDTSGYAARMQIKDRSGGTVLAAFTEGAGLTNAGGIITLRIGADATAALPRGGYYDLELHAIADATEVVRLVQGKVSLSYEVTTA